MFSFLQQLVPKRRDDLDADEDAYAESSAMPAFVPPAPLVKPPPTEEEIAEQEREAAEAEAREAAERAEAERLEQEALEEEKRRAEERLVERQERARILLEERAAERQRREEAHAAANATLVAVPDIESESVSESASESVEAIEAHVVEDEAPAIEEDAAPAEHDDDSDGFAFVPPAPEAEHVADDAFEFVPPAPEVEHVAHVESVDDVADADDAFAFVPPAPEAEQLAHVESVDDVADADADVAFVPPAAHLVEHEEHVPDVEPMATVAEATPLEYDVSDEHVEVFAHAPEPEPEPEPESEPVAHDQHVHAHVGAAPEPTAPARTPPPVAEAVERYTWPATLLHLEHAMQYGEPARRNLISMIVELNDPKLAHVLHDALYEERADGLRPEVLSALQRSYNGEALRETYERFVRIGSDVEREIAREGIRSLDEGRA
jgi:hypothetical protein